MSPTATLTLQDLASDLRVSEKTIRRMIRDGRLPQPMRINNKDLRWLMSEIKLWLDSGMPSRQEFEAAKASSN